MFASQGGIALVTHGIRGQLYKCPYTFTWTCIMTHDMLGVIVHLSLEVVWSVRCQDKIWGSSSICTYLRLGLFNLRHQISVQLWIFLFHKTAAHSGHGRIINIAVPTALSKLQIKWCHAKRAIIQKDCHSQLEVKDFKKPQKPEEVVNLQSNADDAGQKANSHKLCVDWNN